MNLNLIKVITTDGREIMVDINNDKCSAYGFLHNEIAHHNGLEIRMEGVGLNINGDNVLYYEILHNKKTAGKVCCFEKSGNLLQYGFRLKV